MKEISQHSKKDIKTEHTLEFINREKVNGQQ